MRRLISKAFAVPAFFIFLLGCSKNGGGGGNPTNTLLQHKWTLVSRTATFPTMPSVDFAESDAQNDYFDFRSNDTVYSYVTAYAPFSIDTVFYVVASSNSIYFYVSQNQNGFIFQSQDTMGMIHDTTLAHILTLTSSSLVLSFPTIGTITNLTGPGITNYYPGTEIDSLIR